MATKIGINGDKVRCVYDDRFRPLLEALGTLQIDRASTVEYNPLTKNWEAKSVGDILPEMVIASGPNRNEVIEQEVKFLEDEVICRIP